MVVSPLDEEVWSLVHELLVDDFLYLVLFFGLLRLALILDLIEFAKHSLRASQVFLGFPRVVFAKFNR